MDYRVELLQHVHDRTWTYLDMESNDLVLSLSNLLSYQCELKTAMIFEGH